jgi:hypothetical protein
LAIIWGLLGRLKVPSGYPVYVNEACECSLSGD